MLAFALSINDIFAAAMTAAAVPRNVRRPFSFDMRASFLVLVWPTGQ